MKIQGECNPVIDQFINNRLNIIIPILTYICQTNLTAKKKQQQKNIWQLF